MSKIFFHQKKEFSADISRGALRFVILFWKWIVWFGNKHLIIFHHSNNDFFKFVSMFMFIFVQIFFSSELTKYNWGLQSVPGNFLSARKLSELMKFGIDEASGKINNPMKRNKPKKIKRRTQMVLNFLEEWKKLLVEKKLTQVGRKNCFSLLGYAHKKIFSGLSFFLIWKFRKILSHNHFFFPQWL